jgi:RNA polymerase sigma-70 factor (ECF subfamily)
MTSPLPAMIRVMEARTSFAPAFSTPAEGRNEARRFEAIYGEHFGSINAYARRRLPARADDVVAETFLVVWRRLDEIPADALPWLYGVARRVVSDFRRSAQRQEAVAERLAGGRQPEPSEGASDAELLSALTRLSESDRELLLLVYWEDLEPRRAARAFGCSRATVATRLWRTHGRLRDELERMRGERR